jgi:hypothetical protein
MGLALAAVRGAVPMTATAEQARSGIQSPAKSRPSPLQRRPFNYGAEAELFARQGSWRGIGYRRFASASRAIQYAVEELDARYLSGTIMQVDEERFDGHGIRLLYDALAYPLERPSPPAHNSS